MGPMSSLTTNVSPNTNDRINRIFFPVKKPYFSLTTISEQYFLTFFSAKRTGLPYLFISLQMRCSSQKQNNIDIITRIRLGMCQPKITLDQSKETVQDTVGMPD
jgi:hypothetical protein